MAKKAKKVSWRTLARRAKKQKNPGEAAWLRRKSAALRRADRAAKQKKVKKAAPAARRDLPGAVRAAKGWATRRANEIARAVGGSNSLVQRATIVQRNDGAPQGIDRTSPKAWRARVFDPNASLADTKAAESVGADRGLPGQGELVGGAFSQLADRIAKLARKKGGSDDIQNELAALASSSKYEGCAETDKAATKQLVEVQQIMADRIVCGFIAEVDMAMKLYRGLPPDMVWNLNSFTVVKIVDALNKAGYRATGKT